MTDHADTAPAESDEAADRGSLHDRVLAVLRASDHPLTINEVADRAGCAQITARRWLTASCEWGLVELVGSRPRRDPRTQRVLAGSGPYVYTAVH